MIGVSSAALAFRFFDVVILEGRDLLRLAILGDGELFLFQSFNRFAIAVRDLHIDFDQIHGRANRPFPPR